jgi:hypothetical protein
VVLRDLTEKRRVKQKRETRYGMNTSIIRGGKEHLFHRVHRHDLKILWLQYGHLPSHDLETSLLQYGDRYKNRALEESCSHA